MNRMRQRPAAISARPTGRAMRHAGPPRERIAVSVQDGNDLQGLRLGAVDNQIRIHREKPHAGSGEVAPPVSPARKIRQIDKLATDDGFHAVGGFLSA